MDKSSEVMWVHVVRIVSILFVVCVHASAEVFFLGAKFGSYEWWVANTYDSLVRVCVPMLFMVSGYLLLGKSEPLPVFLKKRVHKVVVPLLVWSAFFLLWVNLWEYQHPSAASSMTPVDLQRLHDAGWRALIAMLWCPIYFHLWFLYVIFGMYLVTPLLRIIVQHAERRLLWYFVFLSALGTIILGGLERITKVPNVIDLSMAGETAGYFIFGYLLGTITISRKLFRLMVPVVLISGIAMIFGTYYLTAADNGVLNQTMWRNGPAIAAMSASAFIIIRYLSEQCKGLQSGKLASVTKSLSAASFGIYLVHVMFLYAFAEGTFGFRLTSTTGDPLYFVPIVIALTYAASFIVIYGMQRVPVVRHAVP